MSLLIAPMSSSTPPSSSIPSPKLHALCLTATAPGIGGASVGGAEITFCCRECLSAGEGTKLCAADMSPAVASVVADAASESLFTPPPHAAASAELFAFDRVPAALNFLFSPFALSPLRALGLASFLEYDGLSDCRVMLRKETNRQWQARGKRYSCFLFCALIVLSTIAHRGPRQDAVLLPPRETSLQQ